LLWRLDALFSALHDSNLIGWVAGNDCFVYRFAVIWTIQEFQILKNDSDTESLPDAFQINSIDRQQLQSASPQIIILLK